MENVKQPNKQKQYEELAAFLLHRFRKKGRTKNK
jgi:hypothetical protein